MTVTDPNRAGHTLEYIAPAADEQSQSCPTCHHPSCEGFYYADPSCGARD